MLNNKKHISTTICSLDKIYSKATFYGKLQVKELYELNIIYKLLNKYNLTLTNDQINKLTNYYNKLIYQSDMICNPLVYKTYQTTSKKLFEQNQKEDCNTYPAREEILYWQEDFTLNNSDIITLINTNNYLIDKPSATYSQFENSLDIDYNKIGKIIFLILESFGTNYKVFDVFNNDITHTFILIYIPVLNSTVIISNNIYSHGTINFKIKKI